MIDMRRVQKRGSQPIAISSLSPGQVPYPYYLGESSFLQQQCDSRARSTSRQLLTMQAMFSSYEF